MKIGDQVHKYRKLKKWTLGELGERSGLAPSTLCDAENGRSALSVKSLEKIADALGIDLEYLFKKE